MSNRQEARNDVVTSYRNAPTRTVSAGGVDFAYRELGPTTGVPVVFVTHLRSSTTGTLGSSTVSPRNTGSSRSTTGASAPPPARRRTPFR
jgi:hypothetical protein